MKVLYHRRRSEKGRLFAAVVTETGNVVCKGNIGHMEGEDDVGLRVEMKWGKNTPESDRVARKQDDDITQTLTQEQARVTRLVTVGIVNELLESVGLGTRFKIGQVVKVQNLHNTEDRLVGKIDRVTDQDYEISTFNDKGDVSGVVFPRGSVALSTLPGLTGVTGLLMYRLQQRQILWEGFTTLSKDQELLSRVVMEGKFYRYVLEEVLNHLTDVSSCAEGLVKLIEDEDLTVDLSLLALSKIPDNDFESLEKIAISGRGRIQICLAVLKRLPPEKRAPRVLRRAMMHSDETALQVVDLIPDSEQVLLENIANNNAYLPVCLAAIKRVTDQSLVHDGWLLLANHGDNAEEAVAAIPDSEQVVLISIARSDKATTRVRLAAVKRIKNQSPDILDVWVDLSLNEEIAEQVVNAIPDLEQQTLGYIASNTGVIPTVRMVAIERISDREEQSGLAMYLLAKKDLDDQISLRLMSLVGNPRDLKTLANLHRVPEVRVEAYERLPEKERDPYSLMSLIYDPEVDLVLRRRAVGLVRLDYWRENPGAVARLQNELKLFITGKLSHEA